ncbi:MAG TPA: immunoglobulin domain-containing protein [Verrucomicrobiae bacterium]|nr:immunoglobulin domain-containing protein [Verrucomicrobiae bacterium]
MNPKLVFTVITIVFLSAFTSGATTLARWTFESLALSTANTNSPPNGWCTNVAADAGSGTASGFHATATALYSTPAGNGSAKSLSANNWSVGDFYQFAVSTIGAQNVNVSFDSISSSTGPRDFYLAYSTDGVQFTQFGGIYTNGNNPSWNSSAVNTNYSHTYDLSSVTALNNAAVVYFRLVLADSTASNGGTVGTSGTSRVDNFTVTASTGTAPAISGISPSVLTTNAGNTVAFTVTLTAGDAPLTYFWFKETASGTNLVSVVTTGALSNTLTLPDVLLADTANYQVVVSNASALTATSDVASLSVIDPAINIQPVSQTGLLNGRAQFSVSAGGTGLIGYQWYYCADPSDNMQITSPVSDGSQASGAVISGATAGTLTITNLQAAAATNFVVVVTGAYGSITSSVASLAVATTGPLALWDFNSPYLNVANPAPYQGVGTASAINVTTFQSPVPDANDPASTAGAWGTQNYPASGLNKQAGVQFNISTVGAKNVTVSYDVRGTSTASKYQRLQFTTNGTDWIDYPVSAAIPSGSVNIFQSRSVSLAGFPGVADNPNFGIRLVTEFESTALNGNTNNANYVGISSTYNGGGTLTYDLVTVSADAITNANAAPVISGLGDVTVADSYSVSNHFTVSDDTTPAGSLNVTAASLDPTVYPALTVNNANGTVQLVITPNSGNTANVHVPILVTVTDANGDVAAGWFTLTITPANAPPVIAGLSNTNLLPNGTLVVPFTLTDDHTDPAAIIPAVISANSKLVPNDGAHLALGGSGSNRTLTIRPATNQLGTAPITVSASDGSLNTSQTIYLTVRPNTNVVLDDNFDYDGSGALVTLSGGFWQTHSGAANQLQVSGGAATIDGLNHSEDVNAPLIGGPYLTNSAAVLYSSFVVNYSTLPDATGAYFAHFKDNTTFGFLGRVWASTLGAGAGAYRLGIANSAGTSASVATFPQDLFPGSNYVVVTRLVLSNGVSTLWINPASESSPGVTDPTDITTNKVNIYSYALRESNGSEGILNVSHVKVGLTFDSVFPSLRIQPAGANFVLDWSDPTLTLQLSTNVAGPYADAQVSPPYTVDTHTNGAMFFRFKP